MIIGNIRGGFATNSSSSHSILLNCPEPQTMAGVDDFEYGWEWFHLKDKKAKRNYLATLLLENAPRDMSGATIRAVVKDLLGVKLPSGKGRGCGEMGYIDHQSVLPIPCAFDGTWPHAGFVTAFRDFLDSDVVSIRGGNDNTDGDEPVFGGTEWRGLPREGGGSGLVCRQSGDWFVLFSRETGMKVRVSLSTTPVAYAPKTPELVDLKITDYCNHRCRHCYQDSTEEGEHADKDYISSLLYSMGEAEVFEVAIGGGDPTSHPDFDNILSFARQCNIVPNFSAHDMAWAEDKAIARAVEENCGGFAISTHDAETLARVAEWNLHHTVKGSLHVVAGLRDEKWERAAIDAALYLKIPVTLLGFKTVGRGKDHKVGSKDYYKELYPTAWLLDYLKPTGWRGARVGADTAFVAEHEAALRKLGVAETLWAATEGVTSCYIDAVTKQMGPSSYDPKNLHPIGAKLFGSFPYFT